MRRWKYLLYGLFIFCFTNVFYVIFDNIFRPERHQGAPRHAFVNDRRFSNLTKRNLIEKIPLQQRSARVAERCKDLGSNEKFYNNSPTVLGSLHFYNRSRLCACDVPKAASTSTKRALLIAEFPEKAEYFRDLPGYRLHTRREVRSISAEKCFSNSSTSFLVTRDPYTRLYSAYVDKIFLEKFHKLTSIINAVHNKGVPKRKIKKFMEKDDPRLKSLFCEITNVSFDQFLRTVSTARKLDVHFAPATLLCKPCSNSFDIVLKQETLAEDLQFLFNTIYSAENRSHTTLHLNDYIGESGIENQLISYYTHWTSWLSKNGCILDKKMYDAINHRLWDGLKLLGSIDEHLEFIEELFRGPTGEELKLRNPETILYELKANKVPLLNKNQREKQRLKFLRNAYQNISKEVIGQIQQLFQYDFELFDYDPLPPGW